jgi:hypothetical protein
MLNNLTFLHVGRKYANVPVLRLIGFCYISLRVGVMRVAIILSLLLFNFVSTQASHIVGGEFEIIHLSDYRYRINLIIYYDEIHGLPGNKQQDIVINARIFRFADNAIMRDVSIPFISESLVQYTQPECSKGELITSRMFYSIEVTFPPELYNDPGGYYIIWERCCRNYNITNIFSADPNFNPGQAAGQTFYLKFPPVVMNGQPFVNSSPRLFPPLNDFACPNRDYYVDFGGTDDDGDSLVYSIVTPLSTHAAEAYPPLLPAPYPPVQWRAPFSLTNILGGNPDLRISTDGFLTVRPSTQGLFVFAVKCDEYRDGVKIGEVRRDFQMLVVDACPVADPPQIVGRQKGTVSYSQPNQPLSLFYSNTVSDDDRCVEVSISDPDSQKPEDNFQEKIRIRVFPLNFKASSRYLNELLPTVSTATLNNGSTAGFTICFPDCPYVPNGVYQVGIIAYDDACSLPLSDTLRLTVHVEPPPNNPPQFVTPNQEITINEGDPLVTIPFEATDADLDQLDVFFVTDGFVLSHAGMTLTTATTQPGLATGTFTWDSRCDVYDFTQKTEFNLKVMVEDRDKCLINNRDTLIFDLKIILPGNNDPVISSDLQQANEKRIEITRKIFETIQFNVSGSDADNDFIVLGLKGKGFNPANYTINFPGDEGNGSVTSPFEWSLHCDKINLNQKDVFELEFIVVDNANKCRIYKADTLLVVVHVEPPDNEPPQLMAESMNELTLLDQSIRAKVGSQIQLKLTGLDPDVNPQDVIRIELVGATGNVQPRDYLFIPGQGMSSAEAFFVWNPDCSIFENSIYENEYLFTFAVKDNRCFNGAEELVEVNIVIRDEDIEQKEFLPPNIITPDGDGKNEFFAMVEIIPPDEYVNILPKDNCQGSFVNIRVYDRWGNQVFESSDRDFRWYAGGVASGVYFYFLTYTHKQYKGAVSVKY